MLPSIEPLDGVAANGMYERGGNILDKIRSIEPVLAEAVDLTEAGRQSRAGRQQTTSFIAYDGEGTIHAVDQTPTLAVRRAKLAIRKSVEAYAKRPADTGQPPLQALPATAELVRQFAVGPPASCGTCSPGRYSRHRR